MKIGFCGGIDSYEVIRDAGYDFIEMPVAVVMADKSDEEYKEQRDKLKEMGIAPMAFNVFVPASYPIIKNYMDGTKEALKYCKVAIERVADLGGKIIVFGSGGARRIPEGVDFDTATDMLVEFARDCGDYAKDFGVTIAVEHLNTGECNILTSIKEVGEFVKKVDRDNVKVLYDTYHMALEGEDIQNLVDVIDDVVHIHIRD
ncbi:MAG: sugar phosphate isomerase/epimerase, partial [Clostridiales bacterium]|nr:sugar phosphate isomerase/epimerase [Clostridiales bacterium]